MTFRRFGRVSFAGALVLLRALAACSSTVDTVGRDPPTAPLRSTGVGGVGPLPPLPATLSPLTGPDSYPDPLREELNYTNDAIDQRIAATFKQLFHGDPDNEAIYVTSAQDATLADDEAYIEDVYHDDIRTEGMGLGMLIAVELDKEDEFDKLWTYAKRELRYNDPSSPDAGYFRSFCDTSSGSMSCVDPYGAQMFTMALIFAHDRWGVTDIDYGVDALDVINVMLHKDDTNGGIFSDDIATNTFDEETQLVFDVPSVSAASRTRPSILMPSFYALWTQATGNAFFTAAANSARAFFPKASDVTTGLMPLRAYFDGTPVPNSDTFTPEAYRVLPNLVLDQLWTTNVTPSAASELTRVLQFFSSQGITTYGTEYQLGGTEVPGMNTHEPALVFVNGMAAMLSNADARVDFMQAVWDAKTPTGTPRYYQGIMQLFSLLVLSGNMRVY